MRPKKVPVTVPDRKYPMYRLYPLAPEKIGVERFYGEERSVNYTDYDKRPASAFISDVTRQEDRLFEKYCELCEQLSALEELNGEAD